MSYSTQSYYANYPRFVAQKSFRLPMSIRALWRWTNRVVAKQ